MLLNSPPPRHRSLRRGRVSVPGACYLVTAATDARQPRFADFTLGCAAAASFHHTLIGDAGLLAWVLMPDHVHWLLRLGEAGALSTVVGALKSRSARAVNRSGGTTGPVWARAFHDRTLRRDDDLRAVARYIIANPLRAGLVERVGDYPFWDAVWL